MTGTKKKTGIAMEKISKNGGYIEPKEYFPKDLRKACGLGEYAKSTKKDTKKK